MNTSAGYGTEKRENDFEESVVVFLEAAARGRANAVTAEVLSARFGVRVREITSVVRDLRRAGKLIGSAKERPFGYYIPVNDGEVRDYLHGFRNELFDMLRTLNIQKRAARAYLEQLAAKQAEFSVDKNGQLALAAI